MLTAEKGMVNEKLMSIKIAFVAKETNLQAVTVTEQLFRFQFNEDAMATEKLADGIRKFAADARLLEAVIDKELEASEK